jgi:hypothetical protein
MSITNKINYASFEFVEPDYINKIHYASIDPVHLPENLFFADQTEERQKLVETGLLGTFPSHVITLVINYLKRPAKPFCNRWDTNDFGIQINRLRLASRGGFINEMQQIAKRLRFALDVATTEYYPRDSLVRWEAEASSGGRNLFLLLLPDDVKPAMVKVTNSAEMRGRATDAFTEHPSFKGRSGSASEVFFENAVDDYHTMYPDNIHTPIYLEGGNHWVITDPSNPGRKVCLVGEESFMIALLQSRRQKGIDENSSVFQKNVKKFSETLTEQDVFKIAKEMYLLGLWKFKEETLPNVDLEERWIASGGSAVARQAKTWEELQRERDVARTEYDKALRLVKAHCSSAGAFTIVETQKKNARAFVAKYLAQKESVKEMFSWRFQARDTLVVPQLAYHLDAFMRPGPGGTMLLQEYTLCRDILCQIKQYAARFWLTAKDLALLDSYIEVAERLAVQLEPLAAEVRQVLKDGGLTTIPTPALFYGPDKQSIHVNLINGLSGWSPETNRHYYLVIGVTLGDFLGDALMIMFEKFMKVQVKDIEVIYVGRRPNKAAFLGTDFSEASQRRSFFSDGLHCLAIETEASSHLFHP